MVKNFSLSLATLTLVSLGAIGAAVAFDPPPGQDMPEKTAGGGTRGGNCSAVVGAATETTPLTLLLPESGLGLTANDRPTFMAYVPPTTAAEVEFTIRDEEEEYAYRTNVPVDGNGGVVSISLPGNVPPLEAGKDYMWSVAMVCAPSDRMQDVVATGFIRRIEADSNLTSQLASMDPLSQAYAYGKEGIWFENLNLLAELRKAQPTNPQLAASWEKLLRSEAVKLEAIAGADLVD
ncbi:MAG: DUF928 domain-containing protein [Cyanobacteriota bacterium]|nr:DUF928 domain-containing protein [Cyanobacteriota bacterium]